MPDITQWLTGAITPEVGSFKVDPADRIEQLVDTVGDGSGTTEMATTGAVYKVVPAVGYTYYLNRLNLYMEDNLAFRGEYYTASEALTSGINVTVENPAGTVLTLTPQPVKKLGHWGLVAGVDMFVTAFATGNDIVLVRWTFAKGSAPLSLNADKGEYLKFNVQDSLANAVSHIAEVQGWRVSNT